MKAVAPLLVALLPALVLPLAVQAQAQAPAGLAAVELARSHSCVGNLARLADLNERLDPYARRLERIRALGRAISLEDTAEAAPFEATDSLEAAVANWFEYDAGMAQRLVAGADSTLRMARASARAQILERVRQAVVTLNQQAQAEMGDAQKVEADALLCDGAIFVRPAVLEECASLTTSLCSAARDTASQGLYRFVEDPADLWDVENFRPWTAPGSLTATPDGSLTGGRTAARARKGNIVLTVGLAPMIRPRASLTEEQIGEFEANLDSLGFTFDHPDFVMAPAIELQADVPPVIGGETHYILHFGNLTGDDVIWSIPTGQPGVIQATFPASPIDLARLQRGDVVSLTAVKMDETAGVAEGEPAQAEPVYTVPLLQVNQSQAVGLLLQYMANGDLGRDLKALIPPSGGTGTGGR